MIDTSQYDPYSPKSVDEIVGNTDTWKMLKELINENKASHLVLTGPAGCGKSLFLRLALSAFPTLFIDCTANSGLRDVRDNVRIFARGSRTNDGKLRWIIFEHADYLTADTQAFLRRMLETTSSTTRIIFESRDAGAFSEPIISRSSTISINSPYSTEIAYELLRRTNYGLDKETVDSIVKLSFGNMRIAILNALAVLHCKSTVINDSIQVVQNILHCRPKIDESMDLWLTWAVNAENDCRNKGIDLRDILRLGWPDSPVVSNTCGIWSRLGGTSSRTLFFDCIRKLLRYETLVR